MHELIEFLKELNLPTLLTIIGASWFFTRSFRKEVRAWRDEIKNEIEEMKKEHFEFRNEMRKEQNEFRKDLKFYNIRLARTEGTIYGKDLYTPKEES